jgi:protein ImuA
MAKDTFARLRRRIAQIEANVVVRKDGGQTEAPPVPGMAAVEISTAPLTGSAPVLAPRRGSAILPFGIPELDTVLGGGLRRSALHELRTDESRNAAAMTGFATAVLSRLAAADARPLLWIVEDAVGRESGLPYGGGLRNFRLDPARLIVVRVKRPADVLWVFEEGLRCSGFVAVVTEMQGNPAVFDLTASRRLALRAAESGVTGLLLRPSAHNEPGAALTRWRVSPLPSAPDAEYLEGIGPPAWRLALERNRNGITGVFDVEWNHEQRSFAPAGVAPAHPRPLASMPVDGPPPPPEQRKVMAFAPRDRVLLPREEKRRHLRSRG